MAEHNAIKGVVLDEASLTLEEFAHACAVERQWVVERVESGMLGDGTRYVAQWRFSSRDLTRARRLRQMEADFDAVPELAALVADLFEEVDRLRGRLRAAGLKPE
ncbi:MULTISPECIES: chaperone modulator CbpM [Halomonadaceae]|uniref:MerR family transcriptional regulator n=1 Tax=Modicisalibacter zincidurans TaxID=1178777 RepID=A0ABP9RJY3_9GAMM|nr:MULTISPECIES: chaperone modulator CbpM [Halomonas]MCD6010045.1 chaperone modulator CbpM [Halomonas sp. IOP_31]